MNGVLRAFRDLSLRRKLTLAVVATTTIALAVAFVVLAAYELVAQRRALEDHARTLARVVAVHSQAALLFDDAAAGDETLSALSADTDVLAAGLYRAGGSLFAQYRREGEPRLPERPRTGAEYEADALMLTQPIEVAGERTGSVHLRISTRGLVARLAVHLGVLATVLALAAAVAILVGAALRGAIQGPIERLVARSEALADGNLTALAPDESADEIGVLARSFNGMAARLRDLVSQVRDAIRAVGAAVTSLGDTSQRVVRETQRQGETVERAADSIAHVIESIQHVNQGIDELASAGADTSGSVETMRDSIRRVSDRMEALAPAIETTSAAIEQLTSSVQEVSGHVETLDDASATTERSLEQLTTSVHRVRDGAQRSNELSVGAHREAERGMRSVGDSIASIHEIESSFKRLEGIVGRLAGRSESIGEVVEVIDDVAEETQLLSLNAAIIASQAGEQGSAFAVVADEVKRLAERTARSTREIAELTERIRGEAAEAVAAMGEGAETVERGVTRSEEAGARLGAIMRSSTLAREQADEIARATEGQVADIVLVQEAMSQVRRFVHETRRASRAQERAAGEIARILEQVRGLGNEVRGAAVAQTQESERIGEAMERLTRRIEWILRATEAQRRSSAQIDQALVVFRDVALEGGRRVRELEAVTATLAARSAALEREIGRFTL